MLYSIGRISILQKSRRKLIWRLAHSVKFLKILRVKIYHHLIIFLYRPAEKEIMDAYNMLDELSFPDAESKICLIDS